MKKETVKEFLKPDVKKIVLLIIFVLFSTFITYKGLDCFSCGGGCTYIRGFPFAIYSRHVGGTYFKRITTSYNPYAIIPNSIFWYLVSCMIIFAYTKSGIKIDLIRFRNNITKFLTPSKMKIILFFIFGIVPYSLIGPFLFYFQPIKFFIFGILFLSIAYVFSCLIIFIYDKFKTKK